MQRSWDRKKKTSPNRRNIERETDGQKEGERMQCFMKKEDKSPIDVENVETTRERCCHQSWRTPLNSSSCTFIGMKHISPTFMYIKPMSLRLTTLILQKTFPKCHFTYIFCYSYFALGLHPWLCWLLECSQTPSCPRQLQTCARLTQGWVASVGWPPKQKSWLRQCRTWHKDCFRFIFHILFCFAKMSRIVTH